MFSSREVERGRGRSRGALRNPTAPRRNTRAQQNPRRVTFAADSTKPDRGSSATRRNTGNGGSRQPSRGRGDATYSRAQRHASPPRHAVTFQERYQQIKKNRETERIHAIRDGFLADPDRPRTLAEAITPVGTCQDMCAEFERVERVVQNDVWPPETKEFWSSTLTRGARLTPDEARMVKKFRRAAAGIDEQLPSDLRPPVVLEKTVNYLFNDVIAEASSLSIVHHFIWDRTRAIRNDFSIQQVSKREELRLAIESYERIARFHILSLHLFARRQRPYERYDAQQEREQLDKTLLSLMQYYDDGRERYQSPNEAEFRAYCIIFAIQNPVPNLEDRMQSWPGELLRDSRVQRALELYTLACSTTVMAGPFNPRTRHPIAQSNWHQFWELVDSEEISYLMGCVAEIHFGKIRQSALDSLFKAYKQGGNQKSDDWTAEELLDVLGFDEEAEVEDFCTQFGFSFNKGADGALHLDLSSVSGRSLGNPASWDAIFQKFSPIVEEKRHERSFSAVINGLSVGPAQPAKMVEDDSGQATTTGNGAAQTAKMVEDDSGKATTTGNDERSLFVSDNSDGEETMSESSQDSEPAPPPAIMSLPAPATTSPQSTTPLPAPQAIMSQPAPATASQSTPPLPAPPAIMSLPAPATASQSNPSKPTAQLFQPAPATASQSTPSKPATQLFQPASAAVSQSTPSQPTTQLFQPAPATASQSTPSQPTTQLFQPAPATASQSTPSKPSTQLFQPAPATASESTPSQPTAQLFQPAPAGKSLFDRVVFPTQAAASQVNSTLFSQPNPTSPSHSSTQSDLPKGPALFSAPQSTATAQIPAQPLPNTTKSYFANQRKLRHSGVLDQLSRTLLLEPSGLLDQYVEHITTGLVRGAMEKVELEEDHRQADAFRQEKLRQRFGRLWKDISWQRMLRRRGQKYRQRVARDLQARNSPDSNLSRSFWQKRAQKLATAKPPSARSVGVQTNHDSAEETVNSTKTTSTSTIPQSGQLNGNTSSLRSPHQSSHPTSSVPRKEDFRSSLNQSRMNTFSPSSQGRRRDTTKSLYFKLKARGLNPHAANLLDDVRTPVSTPRWRNEQRPQATASSSHRVEEKATPTELSSSSPAAADDDEALFAAVRAATQAMSDTIDFFKEEGSKYSSSPNEEVTNRVSRYLQQSESFTTSPLDGPRFPRPSTPPKYRDRVSKFLPRERYADALRHSTSAAGSKRSSPLAEAEEELGSSQKRRRTNGDLPRSGPALWHTTSVAGSKRRSPVAEGEEEPGSSQKRQRTSGDYADALRHKPSVAGSKRSSSPLAEDEEEPGPSQKRQRMSEEHPRSGQATNGYASNQEGKHHAEQNHISSRNTTHHPQRYNADNSSEDYSNEEESEEDDDDSSLEDWEAPDLPEDEEDEQEEESTDELYANDAWNSRRSAPSSAPLWAGKGSTADDPIEL